MAMTKKSGCGYLNDALSIVVVGASGDLAKKKTFPALLDLYRHDFLPKFVTICGYSRSNMSDEDLRAKIKPYLVKKGAAADPVIDEFLQRVHYRSGKRRRYTAVTDVEILSRGLLSGIACGQRERVIRTLFLLLAPLFISLSLSRPQGEPETPQSYEEYMCCFR